MVLMAQMVYQALMEVAKAAILSSGRVTSSVNTSSNINDFHLILEHLNARVSTKSARKSGITLHGLLRACTSCSMAKAIRYLVASKTVVPSNHDIGRVSADVVGPNTVETIPGKGYALVLRDDFSRFTWAYPIRHKGDVSRVFERFPAGFREEGDVETIRTD